MILTVLISLSCISIIGGLKRSERNSEQRVVEMLLENYNPLVRPVSNISQAVVVKFSLTLQQIIDVDEKNQLIKTNCWLQMEWKDENLSWNLDEYDNLTTIRISPELLWRPDVLMYNSADDRFDGTYHTNVIVNNRGQCLYVPPGMFTSTCSIDITWFPFDEQRCYMKYGSWTYDGNQLDLRLASTHGDMSAFIKNGEWSLLGILQQRDVQIYTCCPDSPYISLKITIWIRRKQLYYMINIVLPGLLISSLTVLSFLLPPEAGEKVSFGVTILLSLTVFSLLVAETMPPTSDAVPLIGMYFSCILFMCSLSVVFTVLVLNHHHRSAETHDIPRWVSTGINEWLAWILRINRPGKPTSRKFFMHKVHTGSELGLIEKPSKSLLANVVDMEYDIRRQRDREGAGESVLDTDLNTQNQNELIVLLTMIRHNLEMIVERMRKEDEVEEASSEWRFAAIVIDRLCLYIFVVTTFVATCTILFSAPNVFAVDWTGSETN